MSHVKLIITKLTFCRNLLGVSNLPMGDINDINVLVTTKVINGLHSVLRFILTIYWLCHKKTI